MKKKYVVVLSAAERQRLLTLISAGQASARRLRRARTLLLAAEGQSDTTIAAALHTGRATVERTRQRFCQEDLEAALGERPRPGGRPKLDAKQQAHLIALTCSPAPEGRERWTLRLLADRMVELEHVEALSHETVRRTLKKPRSSPGRRSSGASPA
jgi:transposase